MCVADEAGSGSDDTAADSPSEEGDRPGECGDTADNDADGLIDCDDPGCAGAPECDDTGEDTADPDDTGDADDTGDPDPEEPEPTPASFAVISPNNVDGEVILAADRSLRYVAGTPGNGGAVIVCGVSDGTGLASCIFEVGPTSSTLDEMRFIVNNVPYGEFTAVEVDLTHACALSVDGAITCWGERWTSGDSPEGVVFTDVAVGSDWTCGLRDDGVAYCWGKDEAGYGLLAPPAGTFTDLFGGGHIACGLKDDHTVTCWGGYDGVPSLEGEYAQAHADGGSLCGITLDRAAVECATVPLRPSDNNYCITNPPQLEFGDTRRFEEVRASSLYAPGGAAVTYDDGTMDIWGGWWSSPAGNHYDYTWGDGADCTYPWG